MLRINQDVIMPEPTQESDCWGHVFEGTLIGFREGGDNVMAVVRDQDDDVYDIELDRLEVANAK
jgi:hypothetical protein